MGSTPTNGRSNASRRRTLRKWQAFISTVAMIASVVPFGALGALAQEVAPEEPTVVVEEAPPADGEEAAPADGEEAAPADGEEAAPADGEEAPPADGEEALPADESSTVIEETPVPDVAALDVTEPSVTYLVKFAPGAAAGARQGALTANGGTLAGSIASLGIDLIDFPASSHAAKAQALENNPNVVYVEENLTREVAAYILSLIHISEPTRLQ